MVRGGWFALVLVVTLGAGCGGYLGNGPSPRVTVPRPLKVEIKVRGEARETVEQAVAWVLRDTHDVRRVDSGGDAVIELQGKRANDGTILSGTDCRWQLALTARSGDGGELVRERKEFVQPAVTSNVPVEEERLITASVVWALERTGAGLGSTPRAVEERAPTGSATPSAAELSGSDTPIPTDAPAPAPRKKRRHR